MLKFKTKRETEKGYKRDMPRNYAQWYTSSAGDNGVEELVLF